MVKHIATGAIRRPLNLLLAASVGLSASVFLAAPARAIEGSPNGIA